MDDNTLLIIGGGLLFFWYQSRNNNNNGGNQNPTSNYYNNNPEPAPNTPAWTEWAGLAISLYGVVADLWAEGGPLHNSGLSTEDALNIQATGGYSNPLDVYNDPYGNGGSGYARQIL